VLLGIALALAYDEFALWLLQGDFYHLRLNYDAIVIISLLIINTMYFQSFWLRWGKRLTRLLNILFLGLPRLLLTLLTHKRPSPSNHNSDKLGPTP
jgi:hypothetical protein